MMSCHINQKYPENEIGMKSRNKMEDHFVTPYKAILTIKYLCQGEDAETEFPMHRGERNWWAWGTDSGEIKARWICKICGEVHETEL